MTVRDVLPEVPRARFIEIDGHTARNGRIIDAWAHPGNRVNLDIGPGQERWAVNTGVYLHRDDVVKILREYAARCAARFTTDTDAPRVLADDYGAMADFFEWQGS